MKKITLLFILMIGSLGFSQVLPFNFSSPSHLMTGVEGSTTSRISDAGNDVLQIVGGTAPYDHATVTLAQNVNLADDNNNTITFRIKSNVVEQRTHLLKFEQGVGGPATTELTFTTTGTAWQNISLNFPAGLGNYAKIVIMTDFNNALTGTYIIDDFAGGTNVALPAAPLTAAPTPTRPAANVISMFSNAYTNVSVDTWRTSWSVATLTDIQIAGNDTKKYTALDFVGIETMTTKINASTMTYLHVDVWTPNMTTFRVKLVNFGTTQTEFELSFTPTLAGWNSYDIPLANFTGLSSRSQLGQLIISGLPVGSGILFIDNVYYHNVPLTDPNTPMTAAPTPTRPAANVISMFSNAYTNVPVDTWRTSWSVATLADIQIAGNDTKKYTALDFVGIETMTTKINASTMTYLHVDVWTPNMTTFRVKLVNFGTTQTEFELSFTPTLSGWNSYDIPLANFTGLSSRSQLGQLIFSGLPVGSGILFIDNVYYHNVVLGLSSFEASKVKMYPNPTSSVFTIEANEVIEGVSLYNILGQEVVTKNPNSNVVTLDIENLQTGVYVVKTMIGGVSATSRIVKK